MINNLNEPASILVNRGTGNTSLTLKLKYAKGNPYGIGTKVYAYSGGSVQLRELYPVRGFQASSEPLVHFGTGTREQVDSLWIVWPDGRYQVEKAVPTGKLLEVSVQNPRSFDYQSLQPEQTNLFRKSETNLGIDFTHMEDNYTDFNREKLLPYSLADRGPGFAKGDLDGDGREDLFFGGAKRIAPVVYLAKDTAFSRQPSNFIAMDSLQEDVAAQIEDFDGDGRMDLILGSGGGDFFGQAAPLLDRYFRNGPDGFKPVPLPPNYANTSVLRPFDYDGDGDLDLFLGNQSLTGNFGELPGSLLLQNTGGEFEMAGAATLECPGMVTDATWSDFDGDGTTDLVVVGEWMPPRFFKNTGGTFREVPSQAPAGLWQCITPYDIDGDGDTDYLLGNWGANSKFTATKEAPLRMYYADFDGNGSTETVLATSKKGTYYPIAGLDDLGSQMVSLRKKYPNYRDFAGRAVGDIFEAETLEAARLYEVSELRSGYLKNEGGKFEFHPFPDEMQVAPVLSFLPYDFDGDGRVEVLAGGNYFGVKPYHGRFDAFPGALIRSETEIVPGNRLGLEFMNKSVRHLSVIKHNNQDFLLVVYNSEPAEVYQLMNHK